MNLIATMPVRNEDWVIGLSARAALKYCDSIVVLDHASTDRTPEILRELSAEFPGRVDVTRIDDPAWNEMAHRDVLLNRARALSATHIVIVDADEILTGNLLGTIRGHIESMGRNAIMQLPGYNLRGGIEQFHSTGIWAQRWFSFAFMDNPRLCWSGDQFHHREPMGAHLERWFPIPQSVGGVMHLWGASEERLKAKHAAYKITEALRWPNKSRAEIEHMYSLAFNPALRGDFDQNWQYANTPAGWWAPYADIMQYLDVNAKPWQANECQSLVAAHGRDRFSGLDLLGVA